MPGTPAPDRATRLLRRTRRQLLIMIGGGVSTSLLAACQSSPPAAAPAATSAPAAPAKPTEAPKPAAAAPTSVPTQAPAVAPTAAPAAKPTEAAKPSASGAPAEKPQMGGELIVANWDEPISLDPANINAPGLNAASLFYDRLVYIDKELKYHPGLAEAWEIAPDGKSYTFRLKKNVKFHDGTPFNAKAVQYSLDRATQPGSKSTFSINIAGHYDRTETPDDFTAKVVLKQPFAPFMTAMSEGFYGIVSPAAVEKFGADFARNPVGSGPFIFDEWQSKSHVTGKRNPDYNWGSDLYKHAGAPYLDKVSVRLIADANIRMSTVETGEVHWAIDIPPEELERLKANNKLQIVSEPTRGDARWFEINTPHAPVDDLKVRQAVLWAVSPEDVAKTLFRNAVPPARTPLAPGTFGFDQTLNQIYPKTDLDKSRALLEEAGWKMGSDGIREKDGKKLEMSINIVASGIQALPIKVSEIVQAQLREVGILFTPKQFDTAALFQTLLEGSEMMTYDGSRSPDPDILRALLHSSFIGKSVSQRVGYKDPHLDDLLEKGAAESDATKRAAIYREIQEIMLKQALVVPLWYGLNTYVGRANVRDVVVEPFATISVQDVWLAPA